MVSNDQWYITILEEGIQIIQCNVYDRWGELIFLSNNDNDFKWDGTFKGKKLNPGVFVYRIYYKDNKGQFYDVTGSVTLL